MSQNPKSKLLSNGFNFVPTTHKDTHPAIDPEKHSDLSGKHVLITGASRGIGKCLVLSFTRAGAASICLAARSSLSSLEKEIESAAKAVNKPAPKVLSIKLDVTDQESVEAAAKRVEEELGRLDILINNAGYLPNFAPIAESDPDEWWRTWEVNIKGPYLVTRYFLPLMLKGGDKTIINVASVGAHVTAQGASPYESSKLALLRFTEFIVSDYGEQGVLAYAIHPGGIETELSSRMPKQMQGLLNDTPELAADTIVYLTRERREWLAGRYVSCQWDIEEFLAKKDEIVEGDLLKVRMAVEV